MADKIMAATQSLTAQGGNAGNERAILEAFCTGIIAEIVANSELVPLTQDSGTAGAGIITGKVM
jgi:hypothetical protein